jgi:monoamine oxidase
MAEFDALARGLDPARPWDSPNAAELDRISLGSWLASKHIDAIDFLTWQFASILTAGVSVSEVSLLYYLTMVQSAGGFQGLEAQREGAQETRFVGGSQTLSLRMAELIGNRLLLDHAVTRIEGWDQPTVEVHTAQQVFRARAVIVALSPPLCRAINFFPALPNEQLELQRRWPAHAPMMKSATVYPRPFWFDEGYNGQVASGDGPVIWSFDNSPPDHHFGVINAFLRAGETPSDHEAAMKAVTTTLARALKDDRLLHPLEFHLQDWGQEPYTLSCVSPLLPGFMTSGLLPFLGQPVGSLLWAGTETAEIWKGYMDGAVRSGHRAALQTLQHLSTAGKA